MNKAEERYMEIIEILKKNPIVTVTEFANQLEVSPETIRKDLTALAKQGVITRIHGGAALAAERMVSTVSYTHLEQKLNGAMSDVEKKEERE